MSLLPVPLFSQRDDRWKRERLGWSDLTLGSSGCLVTCLAMLAAYYGRKTRPDEMNEDLKRVGGFYGQNLYIWGKISDVHFSIRQISAHDTPYVLQDSDFRIIDEELNNKYPVIVEVDMVPATAKIDMHFVLIIGKQGSKYKIADPWTGTIENLDIYGEAQYTIQKYVFHHGDFINEEDDEMDEETKKKIDEMANQITFVKNAVGDMPTKDELKGVSTDLADKIDRLDESLDSTSDMLEEGHADILIETNEIKTALSTQPGASDGKIKEFMAELISGFKKLFEDLAKKFT